MNEQSKDTKEREENYKALVDFLKKDAKIKTSLMSLAPNSRDDYDE